jgi:hypothetical protein
MVIMLNHLMQVQVGFVTSQRYNVHNIRMRGDAAFADTVAVEEFVEELQYIIGKEVTHINKFSVLMRRLFSGRRCFLGLNISQEKVSAPRFKAAKDTFTLLSGGDAEGNDTLKP